MEQYPRKTSHYLDKNPMPVAHADNDPIDYAYIYRKVSKHYSLVLLSMREVFWTYYGQPEIRNITDPSNVATRLYPFSPYLRPVHGRVHVPYLTHTFIAYVHANIISHTTNAHQHSKRMLPYTTNITLLQSIHNLSSTSSLACNIMVPYVLSERT